MKTLKFGIEIETVGVTRHALALAIHGVVAGPTGQPILPGESVVDTSGRTWRVVYDASLSGGDSSGEIVSPVLGYEDIDLLQRVVRAVPAAVRASTRRRGIHIHIGAAQFDAKSITNLVKLVHKQEQLLQHALGVSERRLGRYCRPIELQTAPQAPATDGDDHHE